MTITEFKKMKVIKMDNKVIENVEKSQISNTEDEGISWGMGTVETNILFVTKLLIRI